MRTCIAVSVVSINQRAISIILILHSEKPNTINVMIILKFTKHTLKLVRLNHDLLILKKKKNLMMNRLLNKKMMEGYY